MAVRSEFTELMTRNMYGYYLERYDTFDPVYPQIFEVETMEGAYDKETSAIGLGKLSERREGDTIVASNILEGFTAIIKARTFSDSFFMTMEFVEDTPKEKMANVIKDFANTWAEGVVATKEAFAASLFNTGGFTSATDAFNNSVTGVITDPTAGFIYDGLPFFALAGAPRTAKNGTTYYNSIAANTLSAPNLITAYNLMTVTNNRNERGEIVNLKPDVLLHPSTLRFTAKALLESDKVVGSANNDINTVQNLVKPIEWQYLTDTDGWFLGKAKSGIKFKERKAPVIDFYQNEIDKKYYATIDTRFGAGVSNWRYWQANAISTS